jgi:hypothetical protein
MLDTGTDYLASVTYGIDVSGASAGTVRGVMDIIVPETFGLDRNVPTTTYTYRAYPTAYPYPTYPTDRNTDSGSNSTGPIVVVVMGVLTVVFVTMYCVCKSTMKNDDERKKRAAQAVVNQVYTQEHNHTEVVRNPRQPTQFIVRPTEVPIAQVSGMDGPHQMKTAGQPHLAGVYPQMPGQSIHTIPQPAPTTISDASTISPATATAAMTTTPPLQSVQDQLQHLQFSSHPRPNFVTSVGDNDQRNSQQQEVDSGNNSATSASPNVSLSASHIPSWEPQPWIPPTRPANSNVNPSTLTQRSLPPSPSHETSPNLMQESPGRVGSNNPPYHGNV